MKMVVNIVIALGLISFVAGMLSRVSMIPLRFFPGTLSSGTMLAFTNTCMLIAIAISLAEKSK